MAQVSVGQEVSFYNLSHPLFPGPTRAEVRGVRSDGRLDLVVYREGREPHLEELVNHQRRADGGRYWRAAADGAG